MILAGKAPVDTLLAGKRGGCFHNEKLWILVGKLLIDNIQPKHKPICNDLFGASPQFHVGVFTYEEQGHLGPRIQQNLQLVYIFEGDAVIRIDGKNHYLGPREAHPASARPGGILHFFQDTPNPARLVRIGPTATRQIGFLDATNGFLSPAANGADGNINGDGAFARQRRCDGPFEIAQRSGGSDFLESLSRQTWTTNCRRNRSEAGEQARAHIEAHHAKPCDLETLSRIAGVSGAHLSVSSGSIWKSHPSSSCGKRASKAERGF